MIEDRGSGDERERRSQLIGDRWVTNASVVVDYDSRGIIGRRRALIETPSTDAMPRITMEQEEHPVDTAEILARKLTRLTRRILRSIEHGPMTRDQVEAMFWRPVLVDLTILEIDLLLHRQRVDYGVDGSRLLTITALGRRALAADRRIASLRWWRRALSWLRGASWRRWRR